MSTITPIGKEIWPPFKTSNKNGLSKSTSQFSLSQGERVTCRDREGGGGQPCGLPASLPTRLRKALVFLMVLSALHWHSAPLRETHFQSMPFFKSGIFLYFGIRHNKKFPNGLILVASEGPWWKAGGRGDGRGPRTPSSRWVWGTIHMEAVDLNLEWLKSALARRAWERVSDPWPPVWITLLPIPQCNPDCTAETWGWASCMPLRERKDRLLYPGLARSLWQESLPGLSNCSAGSEQTVGGSQLAQWCHSFPIFPHIHANVSDGLWHTFQQSWHEASESFSTQPRDTVSIYHI